MCIVWEFANIDAHILRTLYGIEWIEDTCICHIGPYITEHQASNFSLHNTRTESVELSAQRENKFPGYRTIQIRF